MGEQENICKNCKYFILDNSNLGQCVRYPPQTTNNNGTVYSNFPIVFDTSFCGEFKENDDNTYSYGNTI